MKTAKDFSESDSIVGGRPSLREGRPPKRPFEKTNIRSIQLHLQVAPKHSFRAEIYSSNKNLWVAPHYTSIQKHNRSLTRLCRMPESTASFSVKTAKDFSESDSIVGGDLRFSGGRPRYARSGEINNLSGMFPKQMKIKIFTQFLHPQQVTFYG